MFEAKVNEDGNVVVKANLFATVSGRDPEDAWRRYVEDAALVLDELSSSEDVPMLDAEELRAMGMCKDVAERVAKALASLLNVRAGVNASGVELMLLAMTALHRDGYHGKGNPLQYYEPGRGAEPGSFVVPVDVPAKRVEDDAEA